MPSVQISALPPGDLGWCLLTLQASEFWSIKWAPRPLPPQRAVVRLIDNQVIPELKKGDVPWLPRMNIGPQQACWPLWSHRASETRLILCQGPVHLYSLKAWCGQETSNNSTDFFSQSFLFINGREANLSWKVYRPEYVKHNVIVPNPGFLVESTQSFKQTPVSKPHPRPIKSGCLAERYLGFSIF